MNRIKPFCTNGIDTLTVLLQPIRVVVFPQASGLIWLQLHKYLTFMSGNVRKMGAGNHPFTT